MEDEGALDPPAGSHRLDRCLAAVGGKGVVDAVGDDPHRVSPDAVVRLDVGRRRARDRDHPRCPPRRAGDRVAEPPLVLARLHRVDAERGEVMDRHHRRDRAEPGEHALRGPEHVRPGAGKPGGEERLAPERRSLDPHPDLVAPVDGVGEAPRVGEQVDPVTAGDQLGRDPVEVLGDPAPAAAEHVRVDRDPHRLRRAAAGGPPAPARAPRCRPRRRRASRAARR